MAEAQADLQRASPVHRRAVSSDLVLPLLEGFKPEETGEEVVFECEGVDIAMDSIGQRFVACVHPSHGHAPRYAELAKRMAAIRCRPIDKQLHCALCGGSGWLPINSGAAQQQYALMRAIGFFRGLPIPQLARNARLRRVDGDTSNDSMPGV